MNKDNLRDKPDKLIIHPALQKDMEKYDTSIDRKLNQEMVRLLKEISEKLDKQNELLTNFVSKD